MTQKTLEEEKMEMIVSIEAELNNMVRPVIERRMDEYRQQFGRFEMIDSWLWDNINTGLEVLTVCNKTLASGDK